MSAERKIGVLIPEVVDYLEYSLLSGIFVQAKKLNCDVLVFTDTFNAIDEIYYNDYIAGQENIYRLALEGSLDGILFAAERFHNKEICNEIYERCRKLSIPCLVIEQENDILPYISAHQTKPIKELTEHLIHKHNCRRLYFLSGIKGHSISKQREKGFIEAMEENGLPVDEDSIFYGDFWIDKPYQLGIDIASGKIPMPDAVVCASDTMASALCDALMENGVSVPGDVAVTGYDGNWSSYMHKPRITTIIGREDELGGAALCRLYEMMTGKACKAPENKQIMFPGTSCGCSIYDVQNETEDVFSLEQYVKKMMERYFARKNFMASDYISIMTDVETTEQLIEKIDGLLYTLHGVNCLEICLCEDWMFDFENPDNYRKKGFSENMLLALSKRPHDVSSGMSVFPSSDIIPFLQGPHDPQLIVLTSLHHRNQVFGYTALTYRNVEDIFADAHYISWCDAVASGFDTLQKKQYNSYLRQQIESLSVIDPATGLYNKRGLMEHMPRVSAWISKNDRCCICILISYVRKESHSVQHGSDPELMIANALRLSSDDSEILCRLQDDMFAAILPAKYDDMQRSAEERIMRLEEKLRYIQGDVLLLRMPSLVTECRSLEFDKISQAETLISEMQQKIIQKAEAAAMVEGGFKERLHRMRRKIFASPENEWSTSDAAGFIGISVSHFQRMYKSEFGITFKEELITARIEKAKKLLRSTELRVQEVADACGYNDYSHFMRQFKEKVGASALQYRKQKDI